MIKSTFFVGRPIARNWNNTLQWNECYCKSIKEWYGKTWVTSMSYELRVTSS